MASEKDSENNWVIPEYATNDKIHTFPGSSVLVREQEPSSTIAYALSCKDYLKTLSRVNFGSHDENASSSSSLAPRPPEKDTSTSNSQPMSFKYETKESTKTGDDDIT